MNHRTLLSLLICFIILYCNVGYADGLWQGEADELGNSRVVTASRSSQDKFESVLSISSIDREQILKTGVTNIAEALQLIPGVLVTRQNNGVFDVHIRGLSFVPEQTTMSGMSNRRTLLMIDNRPVFDFFNGETLLENLPVSLIDVERIEVVRGAVSALYGPNAMMGVINIITRRDLGTGAEIDVLKGQFNSQIAQISAWHEFAGQHVRINASASDRDRSQADYYSYNTGQYVPLETWAGASGVDDIAEPRRALENDRLMISANNETSARLHYDLSYFHNESYVQAMRLNSRTTPYTASTLLSDDVNLKLDGFGFQLRASQQKSSQRNLGFDDFTYTSVVQQTEIEYPMRLPRWLIRPGIFNNRNIYKGDFIQGEQAQLQSGLTLRSEYQMNRQLKVIGGARYSQYNAPDEGYLDYQLSLGWQQYADTFWRAGMMASHSSPSMVGQYIDVDFVNSDNSFRALVIGDPQARLQRMRNYELAVRHSLDVNSTIDVELFRNEQSDFSGYVINNTIDGATLLVERAYRPIDTQAIQHGITAEWAYDADRWSLNLNLTAQHTRLLNQVESLDAPLVYRDKDGVGTPGLYAGYQFTYQLNNAWHLSLTGNYLSAYSYRAQQPQGTYSRPAGASHNLTINYQADNHWLLQLSARNLSDQNESQAFYGDELKPQLWGRIEFKY